MNENQIYDIVHDYVNENISASEFSTFKKMHPDVEWDLMVNEEQLIKAMFQAKAYNDLGLTISDDIDKIEKRSLYKKIGGITLSVLLLIGTIYYLTINKNEDMKIKDFLESKQLKKTLLLKHQLAKVVKFDSSKIIHLEIEKIEKETIITKDDVVNPTPLNSKIIHFEEEKPTVTLKDEPSTIQEKAPKEILGKVMDLKEEKVKPVLIEKAQNIDLKDTVDVATDKKAKTVNKNYIINPSMDDQLEIQGFDSPIELVIKTLNGELVKQLSFDDFETIIWDGNDISGNYSPVGLYIYQINQNKTTIQFGQITITQ